jgi:acetyltransferase-like isoleucine patch superfamily enzyme
MKSPKIFKKARKLVGLFSDLRRPLETRLLRFILRIKGVPYGKNLKGNYCKIQTWGRIELADNIQLWSYPDGEAYKTCLLTWRSTASIKIGSNCMLNGTVIHSRSKVVIGNNCMFGAGTVILDSDFHSTTINPTVRREQVQAVDRPVVIGNNVWVGRNAIILKGVHIGDNSIVAAGSVVTKSIPPNQVFGGNPARFMKMLRE